MAMVLPKEYSESNDITTISTKKHLEKHGSLLKWRKHESILEFGFGDGKCSKNCLLPILPVDYKEFVVMDIAEEMIEYAKKNVEIPNAKFLVNDISTEEISCKFEERFDHIFGFFALHQIENPRQTLKNIHKMLRPGGQTFLTLFERKPVDEALASSAKHPKWSKYGDYTSIYYYKENPRSEYEKDLQEAGFSDYMFDVIQDIHEFKEEGTIWNKLCLSVNPVMGKLPKEEIEEYTEFYLAEISKSKCLTVTGPVGKRIGTTNYTMFIILASKKEDLNIEE